MNEQVADTLKSMEDDIVFRLQRGDNMTTVANVRRWTEQLKAVLLPKHGESAAYTKAERVANARWAMDTHNFTLEEALATFSLTPEDLAGEDSKVRSETLPSGLEVTIHCFYENGHVERHYGPQKELVESKNTVVSVRLLDDKGQVYAAFVGTSQCAPEDNFCRSKGKSIAITDLFRQDYHRVLTKADRRFIVEHLAPKWFRSKREKRQAQIRRLEKLVRHDDKKGGKQQTKETTFKEIPF
jgi:hypothetical protein